MRKLREEMLAGHKPVGCRQCHDTESLGGSSLRMWVNREWGTERIQPALSFLEVQFSNLCNQKCRMCSSRSSTRWLADELAMGYRTVYPHNQNPWQPRSGELRQIRKVRLIGGEPLLEQDRCERLLTTLADEGRLDGLDLVIQTNGSKLPRPSLASLIRRCREVKFGISVDGYAKLNDYIRSGSNWDELIANLGWFRAFVRNHPRAVGYITSTVSIYNINDLWRLEDYLTATWSDFKISCARLENPAILRPQNLPPAFKVQLIDRYRSRERSRDSEYLVSLLENPDGQVDFGRFIDWSDRLDAVRKEKLSEVNPELYVVVQRYCHGVDASNSRMGAIPSSAGSSLYWGLVGGFRRIHFRRPQHRARRRFPTGTALRDFNEADFGLH
jgi:hypothetical protein